MGNLACFGKNLWETWPVLKKPCGKLGLFWKKLAGNWPEKPGRVSQETLTQQQRGDGRPASHLVNQV